MFKRFKKSQNNTPSTPADSFMEECFAETQELNKQLDLKWGLAKAHYGMDIDSGMVTFTFPDNRVVEAPLQVVGTYDTDKGTFMWGWEHPSVPPALQQSALLAKKWGQENEKPIFSTRVVEVPDTMAWYFAGLCVRLSHAQGVYRGMSGTTAVFVTLGELSERQ